MAHGKRARLLRPLTPFRGRNTFTSQAMIGWFWGEACVWLVGQSQTAFGLSGKRLLSRSFDKQIHQRASFARHDPDDRLGTRLNFHALNAKDLRCPPLHPIIVVDRTLKSALQLGRCRRHRN